MREHRIFPRHQREHLEMWAARGCRISAYDALSELSALLEHGVSFPDAIDALARQLPRPAPGPSELGRKVYDIRDYRPAEDG